MEERLLFRYGQPIAPTGEVLVTPQKLFFMIKHAVGDPKNEGMLYFNSTPKGYRFKSIPRSITTQSDEIEDKINLISNILTTLTNRQDDGRPVFTLSETYDAFSVILCNWMTIHGCLNDGNGRAGVILLKLTMEYAGYGNKLFINDMFYNDGSINMNLGQLTLIYPDILPRFCGIRNLAALIELDHEGKVGEALLNRKIITSNEHRNRANLYALGVLSRLWIKR